MRGTDWALVILCALLVASSPIMALVEYDRQVDAEALERLTGERPSPDLDFRAPWRLALLFGIVGVSVLGTLLALRVSWRPRVRAVSGRLLTLLFVGMTILDFAFLADARWFPAIGHEARAITTVWPYAIGAFLVGGATLRLVQVEKAFSSPV